eukprot:1177914-Prorocentrum_minimum.AAC.8
MLELTRCCLAMSSLTAIAALQCLAPEGLHWQNMMLTQRTVNRAHGSTSLPSLRPVAAGAAATPDHSYMYSP